MKHYLVSLFTFVLLLLGHTALAVTDKQIHEEARFIADKIAHQFNLDKEQFADAYEINYDFLKAVYPLADALIAGDDQAITAYYISLDRRNRDLVWLMNADSYAVLMDTEALFRPLYVMDGKLQLRLYDLFGKGKFYKGKPKRYGKYNGEHSDQYYQKKSYYQGRYRLTVYGGQPRLLHDNNKELLYWARKNDFGK